jgi:hypothetical protein
MGRYLVIRPLSRHHSDAELGLRQLAPHQRASRAAGLPLRCVRTSMMSARPSESERRREMQ